MGSQTGTHFSYYYKSLEYKSLFSGCSRIGNQMVMLLLLSREHDALASITCCHAAKMPRNTRFKDLFYIPSITVNAVCAV